jgi:hypothetical protein
MKNIFVTLFILTLSLVAYSVKAQSQETKWKQQLQQRQQHREAVLLKANEQHRQFQNAGKINSSGNSSGQGINTNSASQQKVTTKDTPAATRQNLTNNSAKKEENNQN